MEPDYRCIGCGKGYRSQTGINNHRRACAKWKALDRVTLHKKKRTEVQNMQAPSEMPGPAHPNVLSSEVRDLLEA